MPIDYTKRPSAPATPTAAATTPAPQPVPVAPAPAPAAATGRVSLTKSAPTVSLTKNGSAAGLLRVNLNWNARPAAPASGGFLKRLVAPATIDLDLGCLFEYADGSKGVVQALGGAFTDEHTYGGGPIVRLDGDDRSGAVSGGENLLVDLTRTDRIRRVLVFAYIYAGVPNWAQADGVVTLFPASGPQVEVRLDESDPQARFCAIAMLENTGGELRVRRENRYVHGSQSDVDRAYGWGLQWQAGRK